MLPVNKFNSLHDLLQAFPNESSCVEHLIQVRWSNDPICPYCSHNKLYHIRTRKLFKCAKCRKQISPTVGTIFEDSHISLQKWFIAIYLITSHKKGISSTQLSKDLGVTQKTAWFILFRIREMLRIKEPQKLNNIVEIDETYLGGKSANKHTYKKLEETQGKSLKTKIPALGMIERDGIIRAMRINNTKKITLKKEILQHVAEGTHLMTDENRSYQSVDKLYSRSIVNHKAKEYVSGEAHTNSIENFWSHLKRGIVGIYHHVSPKHLDYYLHEYTFRFNTRSLTEEERFNIALKNSQCRIMYKELTVFDPIFHNYSGRGVDYPKDRLQETKKRGVVKKTKLKNGKIVSLSRESFNESYSEIEVTQVVSDEKNSKKGRPKKVKRKAAKPIDYSLIASSSDKSYTAEELDRKYAKRDSKKTKR